MKKTLLFAFVLCLGITLSAQNIPSIDKNLVEKTAVKQYVKPTDAINPFMNTEVSMLTNQDAVAFNETIVGISWYDLQSNSVLNNRLTVFDDITMAAVWTMGIEASAFPNRGTGYNYYDGNSWGPQPTERIQDVRCGWPSIAAWGAGGEISVAHNGVTGLEWSQRETKGAGDWTQTNFLGPASIENDITWPRMVTTGENNEVIHLFVNSYVEYMGQATALLYSRSDDGGVTWDPHHVILDGMGEDYYSEIGADDYVMASNGNTAAILIGTAWQDLFMMKTTDNGDTWEKTVIWEHPYPFFDWDVTITDTFFCVDNSFNIDIDNTGKAHVVYGINRVIHSEVGTSYNYYPYVDGIGYWNEDMDVFSDDLDALAPPQLGYSNSELEVDVNYIGWMQDVDGDGEVTLNDDIMSYRGIGPSTFPTIAVSDGGEIMVIYSSTTETYVIDTYNYKHLWSRMYTQGVWGDFMDLSEDIVHIFDESIFPVLGFFDGQSYSYLYHADITPGLAFDSDHAYQENRTYVAMDISTGLDENDLDQSGLSIELNPNPAADRVLVNVELENQSDVEVTVTSMTGQMVKHVNRSAMNAGTAKIGVDVSDLPAGTYICTVKTKNAIGTTKLIVR